MSVRITITPSALKDLQSGVEYYNTQQKSLGKRFLEKINNTINNIGEIPLSASIAYDEVRYKVVDKFPYVILYHVTDDYIAILRVFNTYQQAI